MGPLLRLKDNSCHIDESERVLKDAHKYSELVILYEKKGLHNKGLIPSVYYCLLLVCLEVRGKIIRTVLCCIVYDSCAQS